MSVLVRSRLGGAALAAGVLAVVMLVGVLFVRPSETQAWVYTAAFAVGLVGVALGAAEQLHERHARPSLLPTTTAGRWAIGLALGGVALFVLAIIVSNPGMEESRRVPMFLLTVPAFAGLIGSGIATAIAWFRSGERSLLVLATMLPALFGLYFVVGELVFPH